MSINPDEWLITAMRLVLADAATESDLRRGVSTAYYAVFHLVLRTATEQLRGPATDSAYITLYRRFDHRNLLDVCSGLDVPSMAPRWIGRLGFAMPSPEARNFARWFKQLRQSRHEADYNPEMVQDPSGSILSVQLAQDTMRAFRGIPANELRTILLWMQFGDR